jgi:hypothetical protein
MQNPAQKWILTAPIWNIVCSLFVNVKSEQILIQAHSQSDQLISGIFTEWIWATITNFTKSTQYIFSVRARLIKAAIRPCVGVLEKWLLASAAGKNMTFLPRTKLVSRAARSPN